MPDACTREYVGPFQPLPDSIRALNPDMVGWEYQKGYPTRDRWTPTGWHVITPDGILTYDYVTHFCVRDRVIYR